MGPIVAAPTSTGAATIMADGPRGSGPTEAGLQEATERHTRSAGDGRRRARASGRRGPGTDRDAFTAAVADHHRELARFAYRLCGDRTTAEDIVAEAYARVWPQWRKGRVEVLLPYLMRTVANEAYGRHRHRRVAQLKAPPPGPTVEDPFEDQVDEHDRLWSAIGRLAPQQRVVLVLRIVEDLSEEQTATMLGIPAGTVKSRLSRALGTLRTIVDGSHV